MIWRLLLLALLSLPLFAEEGEVENSLSYVERLDQNLVHNCVCAISGAYCETEVDLELPGPTPLNLQRRYCSMAQRGSLGKGWGFTNYDGLKVKDSQGVHEIEGAAKVSTRDLIELGVLNNQSLIYLKENGTFNLASFDGLSNLSAGYPSGRTHIKNQVVNFYRNDKKVVVKTPKGETRCFFIDKIARNDIFEDSYLEKYRYDENGNGYCFHRGDLFTKISRIEALNRYSKKVFGEVLLSQTVRGKKKSIEAVSTNGRKAIYTFDECGKLKRVERSSGPTVDYRYTDGLLSRKEWPEGRFLDIAYHKKKVSSLFAPVGLSNDPVKIFEFEYKIHKTNVRNAYGAKKEYSHFLDRRLARIDYYCDEVPYKSEEFRWSETGKLMRKLLRDDEERIVQGLFYKYDALGNVLTRTLAGRLTGKKTRHHAFSRDDKMQEEGCEKESIHYTYTSLNLLSEEKHANGLSIRYVYDSDRPWLLVAKYTLEEEEIRKREFFDYDTHGMLVYQSEDNGSVEARDDLSNVTLKRFIRFTLQDEIPVGLPVVIEHYYVDCDRETEVLMKKVCCHYSKEGYLLQSDIYGSDEKLYQTQHYAYDAQGRCIEEIDALDRLITRVYDANGNLVKETKEGKEIEREFDFSNRLILEKETHNDGSVYITQHAYNLLSQCTKTIDKYGRETSYVYDQVGRLVETIFPAVCDENGNLALSSEKKRYNAAGEVVSLINALGDEIKTRYNIRGQPIHIVYPDGADETFLYDIHGKLLEKKEVNGLRTLYCRDYLGRVINERVVGRDGREFFSQHNTYDAFFLRSSIDSEGLLTTYSYDGAGRLHRLKKGEEESVTLYDPLGRVWKVSEKVDDKTYRHTIRHYDALDRVIEERIESDGGEVLQIERFVYDEAGNKAVVQRGEEVIETLYDGFHRPVQITDATGAVTHIDYGALAGFLVETTTDPLGYIFEKYYDSQDRLVSTIKKTSFGIVIEQKEYGYDLLGRRVSIKEHVMREGALDKTITHLFAYTVDGSIEKEVMAAGTKEQKITCYVYDAYRQKREKIKPDGVSLYFMYDAKGRLQSLSASDKSLAYTYQYDGYDRLTSSKELYSNKGTNCTYDKAGRMVKEQLANGLTLSYDYDKVGRARKIVLPDRSTIDYVFDALHCTEISRNKGGQESLRYRQKVNLNGAIAHAMLANGISLDYRYDASGRCTGIASPLFSQEVEYNPLGCPQVVSTNQEAERYIYDDHMHLSSEKGEVYSYDSVGNRLSQGKVHYVYNARNQLLWKDYERYVYDACGNRVRKQSAAGVTEYTYDALDRLTAITENGQTTAFSYDSFHRRVSQRLSTGEEQHFFFVGQEEVGLVAGGEVAQLKVLGTGKKHPSVLVELHGSIYVPIHDIFGNTVALTSESGEVVQSFNYGAFGGLRATQGPPLTPWLYANKRLVAGLYDFGLRFYDPVIGRWLTEDPAGIVDGLNLYAYVRNNPLKYFDEHGLFSLSGAWEGCKACVSATVDFFSGGFMSYIDTASPVTYCTNDLIDPNTGRHYDYPNPPSGPILYACGIDNERADCDKSLVTLSNRTGYNAWGVHAPTKGLVIDLIIYAAERLGYRSQASLAIEKKMRETPREEYMGLCGHSRGCVSCRNALLAYPEYSKEHVYYLGCCPAAYVSSDCCCSVEHVCSKRDAIIYADLRGYFENRRTITKVTPHPDASFFDHSFISPTFDRPMKQIFQNFIDDMINRSNM